MALKIKGARMVQAKLRSYEGSGLLYGRQFAVHKGMFIEDPKVSLDDLADIYKDDRDRFEQLTWRNRLHHANGKVTVPAAWIDSAIKATAKRQSDKIPGKGHATYTKHFATGLMWIDGMTLDVGVQDVQPFASMGNSGGKRAAPGGKVTKYFPCVPAWEGTATFYVLDSQIPDEKISEYLEVAGVFNGLGTYRPQTGSSGGWGRFEVEGIKVSKAG